MSNGEIPKVAQSEALTIPSGETGFTLAGLAEVFVQSGFFKDLKQQSQAIVKMLYGRELGLKPIQSALAIHMVEGRPEISAATLGSLVKRSGKYDYRIKDHTPEVCEIEFFQVTNGTRESIGISRWDQNDSMIAGLAQRPNHKSYPKAMKFARAMSQGVKWYCLDAVGSVPVYTEGEIIEEREAAGLPVPTEAEPENPFLPRRIDTATGEVLEPPASGPHGAASEIHPPETKPDAGSSPKRGPGGPRKVVEEAQGNPAPGTSGPKAVVEPAETHQTAGVQPSAEASTSPELAIISGAKPGSGPAVGEGPGPGEATAPPAHPVQGASTGAPPSPAVAAPGPIEAAMMAAGRVTFKIGSGAYETAGLTEAQCRESIYLGRKADAKLGKGFTKAIAAKILGVPVEAASRNNMTESQGVTLLEELYKACPELAGTYTGIL